MDRFFDPRTRLICAALWALAWLVVAAMLLLPLPAVAPARSDLAAHFLLFAGLALVTIAGATLLEVAQRLVPHRTFDLTDAAANALGASSGYALALVVLLLWVRPADPARRAARP